MECDIFPVPGRDMLLMVTRGCIEVRLLKPEYVEDLEMREFEFDAPCYTGVEVEVVGDDVAAQGIDLWQAILSIVAARMHIIEDQTIVEGNQECLGASLKTIPWEHEGMKRLIHDCVDVYVPVLVVDCSNSVRPYDCWNSTRCEDLVTTCCSHSHS